MDVYSAESAVKRIQDFVNEKKDQNSSKITYEKSKVRYRLLADMLEELAHDFRMLSTQSSEETEVKSTDRSFDHRNLAEMRKQTVKLYGDVLSKEYEYNIHSTHLMIVSNLLKTWWRNRIQSIDESTPFRYNVKYFPKWISAIVCCYGNSINQGEELSFVTTFNEWCSTASRSSYALPRDVQYLISEQTQEISLTSVVLWDMVYDNFLIDLSSVPCSEAQISDDFVFNLAESRSPQNLDKYDNYQENPEILQIASLR